MTNRKSRGWLETVLVGAHRANWCTRPHCDCGCFNFRRAYWAAAARQAGIIGRFDAARYPRDIFAGITTAERDVLVRTLVAGLRVLPQEWLMSEAFRTIIIDLEPPLIKHGVPIVLDTELSATPAGEELAQMRAHAEMLRAQNERRLAYESPQAVEERKRIVREKRAKAHARRQSETHRKNAERMELLAALARLSAVERLSRFATDIAVALDSVPAELVPAQIEDLFGLDKGKATELLTRIDRRKGAWGHLRRILDLYLRGERESRIAQNR